MKARRWLITLGACLLLAGVLAAIKGQQIRAAIAFAASFPEPSEAVESMRVAETLRQARVETIGEVLAPEALELRNELEGRIAALNLPAGGTVRRGEVLLQLDVTEENARLEAAKASAALARLSLERFQRLLANKSVSQDRVDQARAEYDIAAATVRQLEATIAKKTLRAPFDARVGLHELEVGEYLAADSPLVRLQGLGEVLWVDFSLAQGQGEADVGTGVEVDAVGGGGPRVEAVVIARDAALSASSRTLRYRARVAAAPGLTPGTVVNVRVPAGQQRLVLVPAPALLRDAAGTYVFVLEAGAQGEGYRARRRAVRVASEDGETVAIAEGLGAGERIATHGAFKLRHGMLARLGERVPREAGAAHAGATP